VGEKKENCGRNKKSENCGGKNKNGLAVGLVKTYGLRRCVFKHSN
jgi:hypothetical protein